MEISSQTIKITYRFFRDKMNDYDKMNERLFDLESGFGPYNIPLEILYYCMGPSESIDVVHAVTVYCEYDSYIQAEKGKILGHKLEAFLYKNWNRIKDFLKLDGEYPPELSQMKTFKQKLCDEFSEEISNEA